MLAKKSVLPLISILIVLLLGLMSLILLQTGSVYAAPAAANPTPIGPNRYTSMPVDYTLYEWWIADWHSNTVYCSFWVDHEGLPNDNDIASACGQDFFDKQWVANSAPCSNDEIETCDGFYSIKVGSKPAKKDVPVILPPAVAWVSVEDCEPDTDGWCTGQPLLVLTGEEPLPNETITAIRGTVGSDPFTCTKNPCKFKLKETKPEGVLISFWAESSYNDSSELFTATLRVLVEDTKGSVLPPRMYVDVLSTQWVGQPAASCAQAWGAFPPPNGVPDWLTTPASSDDLKSNIPYGYLAANLISQGVVDATSCPGGGLLGDGSVSSCGSDAAKPAVEKWQNQFDQLIFQVAQENQVPAQLLKNLFSRESQFWPGIFRNGKDVGLGQLTENGADTALLWNPSFYEQFCPLILDKKLCESKGYANLNTRHQAMLRGALVHSVDASCNDCPLGLDISRANFSVKIFARTVLANCEQAGNLIKDFSGGKTPGLSVSYEDMWRYTLINYNAGPGCLRDALKRSTAAGGEDQFSWASVTGKLDPVCSKSLAYVYDISKVVPPGTIETPTPTPTITTVPDGTEQPTPEGTPTPDNDGEQP